MKGDEGSYIKIKMENEPKRLYRSVDDKFIAGIAGGLGKYLNIDSNIVRLIFIFLTVFGGSGIILYIILWLIIPSENTTSSSEQRINESVEEMKDRAQQFAQEIRVSSQKRDSRFLLGLVILVLGLVFLLNNFGILNFVNLFQLWPLLIVALGLAILFGK